MTMVVGVGGGGTVGCLPLLPPSEAFSANGEEERLQDINSWGIGYSISNLSVRCKKLHDSNLRRRIAISTVHAHKYTACEYCLLSLPQNCRKLYLIKQPAVQVLRFVGSEDSLNVIKCINSSTIPVQQCFLCVLTFSPTQWSQFIRIERMVRSRRKYVGLQK